MQTLSSSIEILRRYSRSVTDVRLAQQLEAKEETERKKKRKGNNQERQRIRQPQAIRRNKKKSQSQGKKGKKGDRREWCRAALCSGGVRTAGERKVNLSATERSRYEIFHPQREQSHLLLPVSSEAALSPPHTWNSPYSCTCPTSLGFEAYRSKRAQLPAELPADASVPLRISRTASCPGSEVSACRYTGAARRQCQSRSSEAPSWTLLSASSSCVRGDLRTSTGLSQTGICL